MSNELELMETTAPSTDTTTLDTAPQPQSSKDLSVDKKTYRTYGVAVTNEKGKDEYKALGTKNSDGTAGKLLETPRILAETQDKKAWAKAEEDGNTRLSENTYVFYTLETLDGFSELIPDEEQRLFIVNKGIQALQTQKANQLQAELDETETLFAHDGETIDLRDYLNESPKRKVGGSPLKKLAGMLGQLSAEDLAKLIAGLNLQA